MGKFIEEFYYGNIDPQARSTKQNKAVQKKMEVIMHNEEFLSKALSGENKKKFLEFVNAWGGVNGESNLDSFMMGFRLGANFTYDTFVATNTPFRDLLSLQHPAFLHSWQFNFLFVNAWYPSTYSLIVGTNSALQRGHS